VTTTDDSHVGRPIVQPDRRSSADTLLRNLQQQLVAITGQADLKASIIITASSITISLSGPRVADSRLRPGALTLGVFVLGALVCAIFAVLPKYRLSGKPPVGQFNPLFFGHVALLDAESYEQTMHALIADERGMYNAVLQDLHAQSTYLLHHKFRPLRWAYLLLLVGFVAAGVAQGIGELAR